MFLVVCFIFPFMWLHCSFSTTLFFFYGHTANPVKVSHSHNIHNPRVWYVILSPFVAVCRGSEVFYVYQGDHARVFLPTSTLHLTLRSLVADLACVQVYPLWVTSVLIILFDGIVHICVHYLPNLFGR